MPQDVATIARTALPADGKELSAKIRNKIAPAGRPLASRSNVHQATTTHHEFTIKTPPFTIQISPKSPAKRPKSPQNPPAEKNSPLIFP
jgi:hypothetical protein